MVIIIGLGLRGQKFAGLRARQATVVNAKVLRGSSRNMTLHASCLKGVYGTTVHRQTKSIQWIKNDCGNLSQTPEDTSSPVLSDFVRQGSHIFLS